MPWAKVSALRLLGRAKDAHAHKKDIGATGHGEKSIEPGWVKCTWYRRKLTRVTTRRDIQRPLLKDVSK